MTTKDNGIEERLNIFLGEPDGDIEDVIDFDKERLFDFIKEAETRAQIEVLDKLISLRESSSNIYWDMYKMKEDLKEQLTNKT